MSRSATSDADPIGGLGLAEGTGLATSLLETMVLRAQKQKRATVGSKQFAN